MSRVTPVPPPIKRSFHQFVRGISSSASTSLPSPLLDSRARLNAYLPRALKDLKAECLKRSLRTSGNKAELAERLAAHDLISSHAYHTTGAGIRPAAPTVSHRVIPLMQGFHTSAPKQTAHDSSTIDFAFLPSLSEEVTVDFLSSMRVPLLPDNYSPDRSVNSSHAHETLDGAISGSEISIIAAHPEQVTAALSEVVGNEGLDVDIGELTSIFSSTQESVSKEVGVLVELWRSVLDDIFGPRSRTA